MADRHTHDHERMLQEFFAEAPDRAELPASLRHCSKCQDAMRQRRTIMSRLDEFGRQYRADFAEANTMSSAPGSDHVADVIAQQVRYSRRPTSFLFMILPIAASFLFIAFFVVRSFPDSETSIMLGPDLTSPLQPAGGGTQYDMFSWSLPIPIGGYGRILIYSAEDTSPILITQSPRLVESPWIPEGDTSQWPDTIRWVLELYDSTGFLADSYEVEASRRP